MQFRVEKLGFQTVGFQTGMLCVLLLGRSCPRCINGQQVGHLGWVHGFGVKKIFQCEIWLLRLKGGGPKA